MELHPQVLSTIQRQVLQNGNFTIKRFNGWGGILMKNGSEDELINANQIEIIEMKSDI